MQSNTATTLRPRSLLGQGPTCNWTCSPTLVAIIGTEKGELLAPLPYGIFFSILYLGRGARCKFLCPFSGESVWRDVFIFFHPSHLIPFFFLETIIDLPTITDTLPRRSTLHPLFSCLYITSLTQHPHSFPNRLHIRIPAILLSCWALTLSLTPPLYPCLDFVTSFFYDRTLVKDLSGLVVKRHDGLLDTWLFFLFLCLGPMGPSLAHPPFTDDNRTDSPYCTYGHEKSVRRVDREHGFT